MKTFLVISNVEWNSPAWVAGLSPRDTILEMNRKIASSAVLDEIIDSASPGNEIPVIVGRRTGRCNLALVPVTNQKRTFNISMLSQPDPYQSGILNNWLKN